MGERGEGKRRAERDVKTLLKIRAAMEKCGGGFSIAVLGEGEWLRRGGDPMGSRDTEKCNSNTAATKTKEKVHVSHTASASSCVV